MELWRDGAVVANSGHFDVEIDLKALKAAGVVPQRASAAKVILSGKLSRKLTLKNVKATKGARAAIPDPAIEELILSVSAEKGIARRGFTDQEIVERWGPRALVSLAFAMVAARSDLRCIREHPVGVLSRDDVALEREHARGGHLAGEQGAGTAVSLLTNDLFC